MTGAYAHLADSGLRDAAPANLTATAGNASVALSWTASTGATSYSVSRSTVSGGPYTLIASNVTSTSYTDTGVTNGTTYCYVVAAVNAGGSSGYSNEACATPIGPDFSLSAPPFSVVHGSSAQDTVTITPVNGFNGNVQLSASNLPRRSTASFSPNPVAVSSSSTTSKLTVSTNRNTPRGTYNITITGSGGGISHSITVQLTVN